MKYLIALVLPGIAHPQTVPIDVDFMLTDKSLDPLAGETLRLVLGKSPDWQSPGVGYQTDHVRIAVELEQKVYGRGERRTPHSLLTMDINCIPGECWWKNFTSLYTPDAGGRFTQRLPRSDGGWKVPGTNGAVLSGLEAWNIFLLWDPADPVGKRHLRLAFKRLPPPVLH